MSGTEERPAEVNERGDPVMMSVLKSRFEVIVREMTLVVMRASRSAVSRTPAISAVPF